MTFRNVIFAKQEQIYIWNSHAERNAIYNAARSGVSLTGCTIYVPWFPCIECTKGIIQSGLICLVAYPPLRDDEKWSADFQISQIMLEETEVAVRLMERMKELPTGTTT